MPKYLPLSATRTMPYSELKRWWEVDFEALATTAVAEATGSVHPTVSEALRSEDWREQWADALYAAIGSLASAVERMAYAGDPRRETNQKRLVQVQQRLAVPGTLIKQAKAEEGWKLLPAHMKNARGVTRSLLAKHFKDEFQELIPQEMARRGLPQQNPFFGIPYADKYDAIEDAVHKGLLNAPVTPGVRRLLSLPADMLHRVVGRDVNGQEDRIADLRHPLLLKQWQDSLRELWAQTAVQAGITAPISVYLPALPGALPREEAMRLISRRRFLRAVAQRYRECEMYVRETSRTAAVRKEEATQPWTDAVAACQEELARRHPRETEAMLKALQPFCEPGSDALRRECLGRRASVPNQVIPMLKRALADGSWENLL